MATKFSLITSLEQQYQKDNERVLMYETAFVNLTGGNLTKVTLIVENIVQSIGKVVAQLNSGQDPFANMDDKTRNNWINLVAGLRAVLAHGSQAMGLNTNTIRALFTAADMGNPQVKEMVRSALAKLMSIGSHSSTTTIKNDVVNDFRQVTQAIQQGNQDALQSVKQEYSKMWGDLQKLQQKFREQTLQQSQQQKSATSVQSQKHLPQQQAIRYQ